MKHLPGAGQCTAGSVDTVLDGDNGMGMFSRALAEKDIKSASDGRDAAGVSWDSDASSDPAGVDFGKQTVQTYTVNFNADEGTVRKEYLRNGASRDNMYYPVTDYKNLTKILDETSRQKFSRIRKIRRVELFLRQPLPQPATVSPIWRPPYS